MKTFWIIFGVIIVLSLIFYFYNKSKKAENKSNQISVTTKPNVVVINKKPGEQWTDAELKAQGYTDQQITDAKNNVFKILTGF